MKKIISGLALVVVFALEFSGVAVAAEVVECPKGYFSVPPTLQNPQGCSSWFEFCVNQGKFYNLNVNPSGCVTNEEICRHLGGSFYDPTTGNCIPGIDHCAKENREYDPGSDSCKSCPDETPFDSVTKTCYDSNLTPSTLLPNTPLKETDCEKVFSYESYNPGTLKRIVSSGEAENISVSGFEGAEANISPLDVLGCAIKTGRVKLWMVPFYIKYFIQFALSLAGLVAVGAIIIGGYFYLFGSFADDKDKGKRAIIYGLVGFIIAILAWTIVNVVISVATR